MAREVAVRRAEHSCSEWAAVRPPVSAAPARWEIAGDGSHAIWWQWLDAPPGTRPHELAACWYRLDDLGMGLGLYLPRRLGGRAIDVDDELLNVVRLIDLEGWSRRKTGKRLYCDQVDPKAAARVRLKSGRAQLAAAGVLPWAAWSGGKLPDSWWDDPETHIAMWAWRDSALLVRDAARPWGRLARGAVGYAGGLVESVLRVPGLSAPVGVRVVRLARALQVSPPSG